MSRWFPVWSTAVIGHKKFLSMTNDELASWLRLRAHCEVSGREPFTDIEHAAMLIRQWTADAESVVQSLIDKRLLDVIEDGRIAFHDLDDHTVAGKKPSDAPVAVAQRQAKARTAAPAREHRVTPRDDRVTPRDDRVLERESELDQERDVEKAPSSLPVGVAKESLILPLADASKIGKRRDLGPRPDHPVFGLFWDRRWHVSDAQRRRVVEIIATDGTTERLVRLINACPRSERDLFGWVLDQRNAEVKGIRNREARRIAEHEARKAAERLDAHAVMSRVGRSVVERDNDQDGHDEYRVAVENGRIVRDEVWRDGRQLS